MVTLARAAAGATFVREIAASRVSRFLHTHVTLAVAIGLLPFFTPDRAADAAPQWVLAGVLYCLSLSALLLGLSSAHADADEAPLLFTQPAPRWAWLLGKVSALATVLAPAAIVLVLPAVWLAGTSASLLALAAAAFGVTLAMAVVGLAVGLWTRDRVRGLLAGLGVWFVLLFGADLVLLAVAGAPWLPDLAPFWVASLMANPLDALRITVMFGAERTAFAGLDVGGLAGWWLAHGWTWLAAIVAIWTIAAFTAGLAGTTRRTDA